MAEQVYFDSFSLQLKLDDQFRHIGCRPTETRTCIHVTWWDLPCKIIFHLLRSLLGRENQPSYITTMKYRYSLHSAWNYCWRFDSVYEGRLILKPPQENFGKNRSRSGSRPERSRPRPQLSRLRRGRDVWAEHRDEITDRSQDGSVSSPPLPIPP